MQDLFVARSHMIDESLIRHKLEACLSEQVQWPALWDVAFWFCSCLTLQRSTLD